MVADTTDSRLAFRFSQASYEKLVGVRPELVCVAGIAICRSAVDFRITEGLRSIERQRQLVEAGASRTMNSKHLNGRAIDVVALLDGEVRWDWPLYARIAEAFKASAAMIGVAVTWGGDWESFRDGPHYELDE